MLAYVICSRYFEIHLTHFFDQLQNHKTVTVKLFIKQIDLVLNFDELVGPQMNMGSPIVITLSVRPSVPKNLSVNTFVKIVLVK